MPKTCLRLLPGRLVGPLLVLSVLGLADASATSNPSAQDPISAALGGALPALMQQYAATQLEALTEQVCLVTSSCVYDESRLMNAMESSHRVLQAVAELAEPGPLGRTAPVVDLHRKTP